MAAKSSSVELIATLAAKAAQIPSLRAVRLEADYVPARLPSGRVTGIWGEAIIRTPDGDVRELVIGDEIRKGDVIMTTQNGIVEIDDAATRLARFPATEALEQILTDLPPTGAGLGGDPGSLLSGVRVDRLNESLNGQAFSFSAAERTGGPVFDAAIEQTAQPSLTISSPTVTEGSGFAVFTVTLSLPNTQGTTLVLSTTDGSAAGGGVDYGTTQVSSDGGVTWTPGSSVDLPPGATGVLVRVPIIDDAIHEPAETFTLTASTPGVSGPGGVVTNTATATIVDNDPVPTVVSVTPTAPDTNGDGIADVVEGTGAGNGNTMTFNVVMTNESSLPLTHSFSLAGTGTNPADPASDFSSTITFTNGVILSADRSTITVPANVLSFAVTVLTNPDAIDEENETFTVNVGGISGTASVLDDDALTEIDLNGPAVGNARQFDFTENDPATPIAPALTLTDPDSNTISRATVSITGAFTPLEDVLAFTTANGIASNYNAATGVITFTGTATLAQYQSLLQSVTYINTSEDPTATPRTVSFVVFDELDRPSAPALATVNVIPVNDAPTNLPVDLIAISEDLSPLTPRIITQAELLANAADVDGDTLTATGLTITAGAGTLVDNGNGTWSYTPVLNDDTVVSFSYTVSDGILTGPGPTPGTVLGTATLDITPVNDAPTTSPVTLTAIVEDLSPLTPRIITQAELLANAADVDGDTLTATGLTITAGAGTLVNNGNGTWSYTPALNDDTAVSFSYTITDSVLTGPGPTPGTVAGTATLDITPVDDAPINTLPNPTTNLPGLTANEDITPLVFSSGNGNAITVFDPDIVNDIGILTTTVSVAQGTFTLGSINGVTVIGNSNGTSSVTFSGTPTAINTALNGSTYRNVPDFFTHNSNGGFIDSNGVGMTITTTDSTNLSGSDSTNLVIRAVTDIEIITRVTNQEQTTTPFILGSLNNPNDPGSGFENADAAFTAINGIAVAADGSVTVANGVVTLIGTQSLTFTPNAGFTATAENPASFTYTVSSGGRTETAAFFVQVDPLALPTQVTTNATTSSAESIQSIHAANAELTSTSVDVLTGSAGSDVFAWHLGDAGTPASPHAYLINNFDSAPASAGGDILDLRDLLIGENANNLGAFLDFSKSGIDTVIQVSSTGNGQVDQTITLTNVDLAATIGLAPDASEAQMITALINQGKLLVDTVA